MSYQILFTDLDGTLLDSKGQVSPADRAAIALALENGKQIVLCSGRSWRSIAPFEQDLGLDGPGGYGVAFNGSLVYATPSRERKFLFQRPLSNTLGQTVIEALKGFNGSDILVYAGEELYADAQTEGVRRYSDFTSVPLRMVDSFTQVTDDFVKILYHGPNEVLTEVEREMKSRFAPEECNIFFSASALLEFGPPDSHKGQGVRFLADYLRIPMESVITMGDEANDITMLQAAGLGVAVANAVPGAKAAADVVLTQSNTGGALSHVVRTYLLS